MFERLAQIARHERYALCVLAIAIPASIGCYAAAILNRAPIVEFVAYTYSGDAYVIGSGSTCNEAWHNHAPIPADIRELACETR